MTAEATSTPTPPAKKARRKSPPKHMVHVIGTILAIGFLLLVFWRYIFVTILPGNVGVLYSWLFGGTQVYSELGEGFHMKLPWNRIYVFETRVQAANEEVLALSAEGMEVRVKLSVLFRVKSDQAGELLQGIGPEYRERVVIPLTTGAVREVLSRYNSVELYTSNYKQLENDLYQIVKLSEYSQYFEFTDLIIREIIIPPAIANSIEQKLVQEQVAASFTFRLEAERQEAERLRIKALGVQNFYSIVSGALNKNLLTWRGIEATVELAKSPNSKVVIVGSGEKQLPLILGSDIHNLQQAPPIKSMSESDAPALDFENLPQLFPEDESSTTGVQKPATGVEGDGSKKTKPAGSQPEGAGQTKAQKVDATSSEADGLIAPNEVADGLTDTTNTDGMLAEKNQNDGLTSPTDINEGTRSQPAALVNRQISESNPYSAGLTSNSLGANIMLPFLLVIYLFLCIVVAYYGRHRRFGFAGVFAISILLTPFLVFLLSIALDDDHRVKNKR